MDQKILVENEITEGRKLLELLSQAGVPVTAACWVKEEDSGRWYLYLATPLVGKDRGTKAAYSRVNTVIRQTEQPLWLEPLSIKLIRANDPMSKEVQALRERYPGRTPLHLRVNRLGQVPVEEVYIYPEPVNDSTKRNDSSDKEGTEARSSKQ